MDRLELDVRQADFDQCGRVVLSVKISLQISQGAGHVTGRRGDELGVGERAAFGADPVLAGPQLPRGQM